MAWLLTAVVRIAYRHRATAKREHEIARRLARETHVPSGETEELARLRREVDRLPSNYRDAVVLHYLEGLSAAQAGKLLGASEAAVWQRLHRARTLLRSRLPPHFKYGLMFLPWNCSAYASVRARSSGSRRIRRRCPPFPLLSSSHPPKWRTLRTMSRRLAASSGGAHATPASTCSLRSTRWGPGTRNISTRYRWRSAPAALSQNSSGARRA